MAREIAPLTASSSRRRSGGRQRRNGWSAKWSDELKIREGQTAWIQLTPGDYPAIDGGRAHYLGKAMYKVQFERNGRDAWDYFSSTDEDNCTLDKRASAGDTRVSSPRYPDEPNRFWMNTIQFGVFKREPVSDKDGQPIRYKQGKLKGEQVYRWELIDSLKDRKNILKNGDFEDVTFYRKKFLELPPSHFRVLKDIGRRAQSICRCGGNLFPAALLCGERDHVMLDVQDTDLTESEVLRYGDNKVRCSDCGSGGYPLPISECDSCDEPVPLQFWEVVAEVTKTRGESGFPTLTVKRVESIADYQLPNGDYVVVRDEEGDPLVDPSDDGAPFVFEESIEKLTKAQFDLELYTAPKSNSYYSEILGLREGDIGFERDSSPYGSFRD